MPTDIRMIAFDLDETALDEDKVLRPEVAEAMRDAIRQGIVVLPATGRMRSGLPESVLAVEGIRYAVASNGAKVYDLAEDKTLFSACLPKQAALEILRQARQEQCFISIFTGGVSYTPNRDIGFLSEVTTPAVMQYLKTSRIYTETPEALIEDGGDCVEKYTIYYADRALREAARRRFEARGDLSITSSVDMNLELNKKGVNKGVGLLRLAELLGIAKEQVMAVGDSDNDLDMLRAAGFGVAMGNATPAVKQAADEVGPPVQESGLATIIRRVLP